MENKELITKELIKFEKGAIKISLNKEYSPKGWGCSYYLDSDYKGSNPIYYHIALNISQLRELRDILNKELFEWEKPEKKYITRAEFEYFIEKYNENMNRLNNVTEKVNLQIQKINNIIEHIQGITSTLDYLYKYTKEIGRMFLEIAKSFKDEEKNERFSSCAV